MINNTYTEKNSNIEESKLIIEYNSIINNGISSYLSILIDNYIDELIYNLRYRYSLWELAVDNLIDMIPINEIVKVLIKPLIHSAFMNLESKIGAFIQEYQNLFKYEVDNFINHSKNKIIEFICSYLKDTLVNFTDRIFNQEKLQKIDQHNNINVGDYVLNHIEANIDIELSGNIIDII